MIRLTIDNSESRITGLSPTQFKELKTLLSYKIDPQSNYFSGSFSNKRYLIGKRGDFPTGLVPYVTRYLAHCECPYETVDNRRRPESKAGLFRLELK